MHNKQNNKESRTYVQGLRSFGNSLPRGLKGILKKNGYNYSEIIGKWKTLLGKDISDHAHPKSIKMKNGTTNGTLILSVKRGNEIDIEYSKQIIIDKINSYFGYKLINDIRIQTKNSEKNSPKNKSTYKTVPSHAEKKISAVKNKSVRKSLLQFLQTVKND
jgi:hypothetical protein